MPCKGKDHPAEDTSDPAPNPTPPSAWDPEQSLPYVGPQFPHLYNERVRLRQPLSPPLAPKWRGSVEPPPRQAPCCSACGFHQEWAWCCTGYGDALAGGPAAGGPVRKKVESLELREQPAVVGRAGGGGSWNPRLSLSDLGRGGVGEEQVLGKHRERGAGGEGAISYCKSKCTVGVPV